MTFKVYITKGVIKVFMYETDNFVYAFEKFKGYYLDGYEKVTLEYTCQK